MHNNNNNIIYYKKNIKQYSYLDGHSVSQINELLFIFEKYNKVRNYVFSRYSGINSLLLIKNSSKNIRDIWMKNGLIDSWSINRRYVRSAISDSASNIKTMWSNLKNSIKKHINNENSKLTDKERHYIRYILKIDDLYYNVLNDIKFENKYIVDNFSDLDLKRINRYIKRVTRLYKPNISKSKNKTMKLENEIYSYKNGYINFMGLENNKRLSFKVNTDFIFNGTINVKLDDINNILIISKAIDLKSNKSNNFENIIGIDKNFINVLDTSNETSYGVDLNKYQIKFSKQVNEKTNKRNYYYSLIRDFRKKVNDENKNIIQSKIDNIIKNNLGKKKLNNRNRKNKETIKKTINKAINDLINIEKPSIIVTEDITFTYSKHKNRIKKQEGKKYNKKINSYLSSWMKGYIDERLKYKSTLNGIELKYVNPAYTSQICNQTGAFGQRKGELFYSNIDNKRGVYSGYNAAKNIKDRLYDKEINLNTTPNMVRSILQKRLLDTNKNDLYFSEKTETTKTL